MGHIGLGKFIRPLDWKEIRTMWRENENRTDLAKHYFRLGYDSWLQWRSELMKSLECESSIWGLHEIADPNFEIPRFYCGPFKRWQGDQLKEITFKELVKNPKIRKKRNVQQLLRNFPEKTFLIGIMHEEKIFIVEGMYRCAALTFSNEFSKKIETNITIAISHGNFSPVSINPF